ncbi:MAG: polysaccharide biosynthesis tyrosine autokinase, partial [Actinomycetota bacterium]|nr:polysaccharide biosynthesis tyrosine autokinase [Actinomycetota bacterium]
LGRAFEDPLDGQPRDDGQGKTLTTFLRVLRRRWAVIAVCALAACGAAVVLTAMQEKEYESSAKVLFRDPGLEQTALGASGPEDPLRTATTNLELGGVRVVAARTAERLQSSGMDLGAVSSSVEVEAPSNSDLASVSATTPDPVLSARMANIFAEEYIAFRVDSDRARVSEAAGEVRRQLAELTPLDQSGPLGDRLRRQAQNLDTLATLMTRNVELVERARPDRTAVSPSPRRNAAVGLLLGLLLGFALTFLLEQFDRRLREPADVEEAFGLPIVARIPASRSPRRRASWRHLDLRPAEAEAFRKLRANLRYFNDAEPIRSLVVTSAVSGEGKSTVALNLALVEAQAGRRVLLIEANLRRPQLAEGLELPDDPGLSRILAGVADGEEMGVSLKSGAAVVDVIPAGPPPSNPAELLESDTMAALLLRAAVRYDLVLVDTPPALAVSDVTPLLSQVDGVLVVAWLGYTTRDHAADLRKLLGAGRARVLGVVLNGDRARRSTYGAYGTTGGTMTASPGAPVGSPR